MQWPNGGWQGGGGQTGGRRLHAVAECRLAMGRGDKREGARDSVANEQMRALHARRPGSTSSCPALRWCSRAGAWPGRHQTAQPTLAAAAAPGPAAPPAPRCAAAPAPASVCSRRGGGGPPAGASQNAAWTLHRAAAACCAAALLLELQAPRTGRWPQVVTTSSLHHQNHLQAPKLSGRAVIECAHPPRFIRGFGGLALMSAPPPPPPA